MIDDKDIHKVYNALILILDYINKVIQSFGNSKQNTTKFKR